MLVLVTVFKMKVKKVNKANVKTCLANNWLTIATFAGVIIGIALGILSLHGHQVSSQQIKPDMLKIVLVW